VVTDRAWSLLAVVDELMPGAFHPVGAENSVTSLTREFAQPDLKRIDGGGSSETRDRNCAVAA
jgi:hypothetical protein